MDAKHLIQNLRNVSVLVRFLSLSNKMHYTNVYLKFYAFRENSSNKLLSKEHKDI